MKRLLHLALLNCLILASCSDDKLAELSQINDNNSCQENFIPLDEAIKTAEVEFSKIYETRSSNSLRVANYEYLYPKTKSEDSEELYGFYVVNFDDNSGFALLSADRRREELYGISNEGSLHLSDTLFNVGLKCYLNTIRNDSIIFRPFNPNPGVVIPKESVTVHGPLLQGFMSKFHQSYPYNKYCPMIDGKYTLAGCVPVAVSTVMGFHQWPKSITGTF